MEKEVFCFFLGLVFLMLFFKIEYSLNYQLSNIPIPELYGNIKKRIKLFFGIVTMEGSWYKRQMMTEIWIDSILKQGHDYAYCTQNPIEPKYKWTPAKNWTRFPKKITGDVDRERKRVTLANYFLEQTNADFYFSIMDDSFIYSPKINEFSAELGSKYDTEKDLILLGHCIFDIRSRKPYLHGGSGYIMTRKMAKQFVYLSEKWINESTTYDDIEINRYLSYLNKSAKDGSCPYMNGFGFNMMMNGVFNFSTLPVCNVNYYDNRCNFGIIEIDNVYVFHANIKRIKQTLRVWYNFLAMRNDKNNHYGFYIGHRYDTNVCIFKNNNNTMNKHAK